MKLAVCILLILPVLVLSRQNVLDVEPAVDYSFIVNPHAENDINKEPIIGILSQPLFHSLPNVSFIAASYVQFIESSGGRAVPIVYNEPIEKIRETFEQINGLILPGGTVGTDASQAVLYDEIAKMLFHWAWESNMNNNTFAVHGFCMGFQMLMRFSAAKGNDVLSKGFDSAEHANELLWTENAEISRLVGGGGSSQKLRFRMAEVPPVVLENHHEGVDIGTFYKDEKLGKIWNVLSHSRDRNGREYISTVESKAPIAFSGTQWHPEKNAFEWKSDSVPHTPEAVRVGQFIGNRFIDQSRLSKNRPLSKEHLDNMIIWNQAPVFHSPLVRDFELIFVYGPHEHEEIRKHAKNPAKQILTALNIRIDAHNLQQREILKKRQYLK